MNTQANTETVTKKLKKSEKLVRDFNEMIGTNEWRALPVRKAMELAFIHQMEVKNQQNREIYEEKFGIQVDAEDIISDAEIAETEAQLTQISASIEKDMQARYGKGIKAKKSEKKNKRSIGHLF